MCRAARRLRARLGRRGGYLLVAGAGWLLYGVQVVADPRPTTVRAASILRTVAPLEAWGWLWIACSAVAVGAAWARGPAWQVAGFSAAALPPLLWAGGFAAAWLRGADPQAWAGAATWAGASARLMVVAGWREQVPGPGPEVGVQRE
ncbi:hypothetical protein [Streptomyces sp. SCSIO ZS0520]|uniref:hypothetical protein n=1 Tax=Streptomyces sp. SCSIO ZS0520 TaxID=2892996 RepID=UPI0021DB4960|nr:hypothetical protein [Streptomyces sp. SCSIO ZS0520]